MKRSPQEIAFRLRQEAANLWLAFGPAARPPEPFPFPLPRPDELQERLRGTEVAENVLRIADGVLRREFDLLGVRMTTESAIRWRRDYASGIETGLGYFRRIPYLDASKAGDHKRIWELNRHQHLVVLAQAHLLTGKAAYLDDLWTQLDSWLEQNPFQRGMNWTSALEVAFRALSWLWIEHLASGHMPATLRRRWLTAFYQHGRHLEYNLSIYFSPNTHLQGEALALHALGVLFGNEGWRRTGGGVLREIIDTHVRPDGGHFEQSSYYHVYALDMFLFHAIVQEALEPVSRHYKSRLAQMAGYLWALGSPGSIPLLGDDDGGRLFHPYGERREFGRGTLATCAAFLGHTPSHGRARDREEQALWWLPILPPVPAAAQPVSAWLPDSGIAVLAEEDVHLCADTKAFGFAGAGHSHAHALHFTLRRGRTDVLIDPGAYTYVADPALRDRFRGTAMHNTVRIDRRDQADPIAPFRWANLPETAVKQWSESPWSLHAVCRYRGVEHSRRLHWSGGVLFVLDEIQGAGVEVEQFWHAGGAVRKLSDRLFELPAGVVLSLAGDTAAGIEEGGEFGWASTAPGTRQDLPVLRVHRRGPLPCSLAAAFVVTPQAEPARLRIMPAPDGVRLECGAQACVFR